MKKSRQSTYIISGMHCASCAANIQRSLQKQPGVIEAQVNYGNEQAVVTTSGGVESTGECKPPVPIGAGADHIGGSWPFNSAARQLGSQFSSLQRVVRLCFGAPIHGQCAPSSPDRQMVFGDLKKSEAQVVRCWKWAFWRRMRIQEEA